MNSDDATSEKTDNVAGESDEITEENNDDVRDVRSREEWIAKPPIRELKPMPRPVLHVIIAYTGSVECNGSEKCDQAMRDLQNTYQQTHGLQDLPYNFYISKDGLIYEGRGWDYKPFVPKKAFPRMRGPRLVIAQIGRDFDLSLLPPADSATWDLVSYGVENELIHPNADKILSSPWI